MSQTELDYFTTELEMEDKYLEDFELLCKLQEMERITKIAEGQYIRDGYNALALMQGEMAQLHLGNELDRLEQFGLDPVEVFPDYYEIYEEVVRRGLTPLR